jgi:hypothetical protein
MNRKESVLQRGVQRYKLSQNGLNLSGSKSSKLRQIGNAVLPESTGEVAKGVNDMLD